MKAKIILFLIILILISGCSQPNQTGLPNPASVYCEEQGGTLEIRTADDGSQSGYCIFDDFECPQWEYYRGECG